MTATLATRPRGIQLLPPGADRTDREAWLTAREQGIGASEIASALGISPWDSPFSLYWRKKLRTRTDEMTEAMEWGLRHEETISAKFAENHPEYSLTPAGLYRHADHAWMLATPDRIASRLSGGPDELVQIKTAHSWDDWGTAGSDLIPVHYKAQVMQEMAVYGAARCWVPVLVGGNSYREYIVDWNPADYETIRAEGQAFMDRLASDTPPDVDGSASTRDTLKALHPSLVDETVTIPLSLADHYIARRELLHDAQVAFDETVNQILERLGNAKTAVSDGRKIATRCVYDTQRLDTKALKAEHPELIAAYLTTSTVSKLVPAREKQ